MIEYQNKKYSYSQLEKETALTDAQKVLKEAIAFKHEFLEKIKANGGKIPIEEM